MAKLLNLPLPLTVILFFSQVKASDFWQRMNGLDTAIVLSLVVNSNGHILAGTYQQGLFRSTDNGETWSQPSSNLTTVIVNALAVSPNGNIFAGTTGKGVFRSIDNGRNWIQSNMSGKFPTVVCLAIDSNGGIFAGTHYQGLYRSTDYGNTWTFYSYLKDYHLRALSINSKGYIFAAADYAGIFRSSDNGENWTRVYYDPEFPKPFFETKDSMETAANLRIAKQLPFLSLAINSKNQVFAGTRFGVIRSLDDGFSWSPVESTFTELAWSLLTRSKHDIFAGGFGVARSRNNGKSWKLLSTGIAGFVWSLAISPNQHIFVGTDYGVYRSREPLSPSNIKGDVDGDGITNLIDVLKLVGCIFLNTESCNPTYDDFDCDHQISPTDIVILLRKIFLGAPFPC